MLLLLRRLMLAAAISAADARRAMTQRRMLSAADAFARLRVCDCLRRLFSPLMPDDAVTLMLLRHRHYYCYAAVVFHYFDIFAD